MKQKLPFILEIIWLIVMITSLSAAVYRTSQSGFSASIMFFVIGGLAALMYSSRRYMRKMKEKNESPK